MSEFLLTAALAFLTTVALLVLLNPLAGRFGLLDTPGGRKRHRFATPVTGGLAMFGGLLLTAPWLQDRHPEVIPFVVACGILVLVGTLDDRGHVRKRTRLAAQLAAVLVMVYWGGVRIEGLGDLAGTGPVGLGFLAVPFTVFAVMGIINAMNMTDGVDGLAGGLGLVALAFLAGIAGLGGRTGATHLLLVLFCCLAAFMLFNYRFPNRMRAHAFMGDAGSTLLGFVVCWFSISLSQGAGAVMPPILAVWLLAIPILDMVAVMARRVRERRSPFLPDRWHLHHILQRGGMPSARAVNWILSAAFLAATLAASLQLAFGVPQPVLFYGFLAGIAAYVVATQRRVAVVRGRERENTVTEVWTRIRVPQTVVAAADGQVARDGEGRIPVRPSRERHAVGGRPQ